MGNGPQALAAALLDAVYMADKLTEAQGRRVGYEHLQAACRLAASKLQEDAVFKDGAAPAPATILPLVHRDVTEDEIDEDPAAEPEIVAAPGGVLFSDGSLIEPFEGGSPVFDNTGEQGPEQA
jgi:hypothetical protein